MKRIVKNIFVSAAVVVLAIGGVWTVGTAHFIWNFDRLLVGGVAASLGGLLISGLFCRRAWVMMAAAELSVLISFVLYSPHHSFSQCSWSPECRRIAETVSLPDGKVKINNIRAYSYRSADDYDAEYISKSFDPSKLAALDIAFSHWEPWGDLVAHMMLCFVFDDGKELAVSFEPRVKNGMKGGLFLPGVYGQYGQMMLLSIPEDVFDLRVLYRGEDFYRYRTTAKGDELQKMFAIVLKQCAELEKGNRFYHSVSRNCTTGVLEILRVYPALRQWDWRQYINGYYDRFLFEKGFLKHRAGETFESLKARSYISKFSHKKKVTFK